MFRSAIIRAFGPSLLKFPGIDRPLIDSLSSMPRADPSKLWGAYGVGQGEVSGAVLGRLMRNPIVSREIDALLLPNRAQ